MTNILATVPSGILQIEELPARSAKEHCHFTLVIPTFNESKNIENILRTLIELLDSFIPNTYELIVVDDNSPDRTWEIARDLIPEFPHMRVMRREKEKGLSTAVIRGWQIAKGNVLGVIDGDLQHPPEILKKLLQAIEQGADLAVASRHIDGGGVSDWGIIRRLLSRGAQLLGLIILPNVVGRVSDPMSGYFMLRRSSIAGCEMNPLGYKILIEVLGRGNIGKVAEVGYVFQERKAGESKVTWKQYVEYIQHLLKLRSKGRLSKFKTKYSFPIQRFLRFGLVGFSGVFVDMTIFYLLSDPTTLHWGLTRSKVIASEFAIFNNFLWNDSWTFQDISKHQKGWGKRIKRFIKFNLICLLGLSLNVTILNILYNYLSFNRYLANLLAILIVTIWNFWINLKLSWRVTQIKNN
jgi:dolichol-phosphate mannosyltransferase